jgi:hypothetical protein
MNPVNFPLDVSGAEAAAIENTAIAAALHRESCAHEIHRRGLSPATFRRSIILLLPTSRAAKDSGYSTRDEHLATGWRRSTSQSMMRHCRQGDALDATDPHSL